MTGEQATTEEDLVQAQDVNSITVSNSRTSDPLHAIINYLDEIKIVLIIIWHAHCYYSRTTDPRRAIIKYLDEAN